MLRGPTVPNPKSAGQQRQATGCCRSPLAPVFKYLTARSLGSHFALSALPSPELSLLTHRRPIFLVCPSPRSTVYGRTAGARGELRPAVSRACPSRVSSRRWLRPDPSRELSWALPGTESGLLPLSRSARTRIFPSRGSRGSRPRSFRFRLFAITSLLTQSVPPTHHRAAPP